MQVRAGIYLASLILLITLTVAVDGPSASRPSLAGATRGDLTSKKPSLDNQNHLYVLDGWGGVHPVGDSPALSTSAAWPDRDIAFGLALFPDGTGGYVMDGWGGIHPVGSAPTISSNVYWQNWAIARAIVMAPWSSSKDPAGYLLDGWGGIHAFGGAPLVTDNAYWYNQDIARGIVLTSDSTPKSLMGYTLDAYGGVHPFGGVWPVGGNAHWPGKDIARGIVLTPSRTGLFVEGYTLDGYGGIHPFGGAPPVSVSASWPDHDMADSIVAWTAASAFAPGGWVLDRHGGVHQFGSAPALTPTASWPAWDIARGFGGSGGSAGSGSFEMLVLEPETLNDSWGSYYNQRDRRWASNDVGLSTFSISHIGCLLADLAMVYSHFGYQSMTPAKIASHHEWFRTDGAMYNSGLNIPGHSTIINRDPNWSWISAQLAAGHPVIVGMNLESGGTHFVTLTGLNGDSDYWVNDPWEQNAMHVKFSGGWGDRGEVYEAIAFI
jgi:hypothetical protein